jgi:hypothetical protein
LHLRLLLFACAFIKTMGYLERTVYLKEGLELHCNLSGSSFTIGPIKPQPIELRLKAREILRLYKNNGILGHKATADKPAGIIWDWRITSTPLLFCSADLHISVLACQF